jgi:transcriptional regulator with XRE-family HTH domain
VSINRPELAAVLRRARERVQPEHVGLPAGHHRRTPGLRREEVATLAGISVDYVVRLEQGRGPVPSAQVLGALARALRLDDDARDELFRLAGNSPPGPGRIQMHVRPSVLRLIDRFADLPVILLSAKGDVLAWNAMSSALHGDWSALPPPRRNLYRLFFLPDPNDPPRSSVGMTTDERRGTTVHLVAGLRAARARYPDDPDLAAMLDEFRAGSAEFTSLWETEQAAGWRSLRKTVVHPTLGPLTLDCESLEVPDADQVLVVYSAAPDTPEAEALALLRVLGTQAMEPIDA